MKAVVSGRIKSAGKYIAEEASKMGYDVIYHEDEKIPLNYEELGCDVLVQMDMFDYNRPEDFRNLKFVQALMVGTDNKPIKKLKDMNVMYSCMKGVYDKPIAEFVIMRILEIYKQSRFFDDCQKRHDWQKHMYLMELTDKKAAVLGTGHIGSEIAKKLKAFDVITDGFSKSGRNADYFDNVYTIDCISNKISDYDIVIVAIPLNNETYHIFDRNMFLNMKQGSVYVNIGRGALQDENALYEVLKNRKLMGAAVDVFENEPLSKDSPLWDMDNLFYSPHNSSYGDKNGEEAAKVVLSNLRAFINGGIISDLI